ncbi:NAD(+)/NADH kinase [Pseudoxanthobacter sp.]|uniref:ATP-NAD kinase family protein n=1 Tax=Pseudoxanthobacter sp. TaxID=1925742 RepID=UPI002FE15B3A
MSPRVGIIANPVSARDIRRVVASAAGLQLADRANIVLRALAALAATGIDHVVMMPDGAGIEGHVLRHLARAANLGEARFPRLSFLDMRPRGTVEDTRRAARMMREAGVAVIVVLGGDGTHRAVAAECGSVPVAGISTGTNNAFPDHREPTVTGLAAGLYAAGRVPAAVALAGNKWIEADVEGAGREIALVDVAVVTDRYVGARALWKPETFRELFVTFADPEVIGMSAIAGLARPLGRREAGGVRVEMAPATLARRVLNAPIAPGLVLPVGIAAVATMPAGRPFAPVIPAGSLALDGERELFFDAHQSVTLTLVENAFRTLEAGAVMRFAAESGAMFSDAVRREPASV